MNLLSTMNSRGCKIRAGQYAARYHRVRYDPHGCQPPFGRPQRAAQCSPARTHWMEDSVQPAEVAIIGLACRLPAAATPGEFWRLVRDGLEATALPGNVAEFDADFFNL